MITDAPQRPHREPIHPERSSGVRRQPRGVPGAGHSAPFARRAHSGAPSPSAGRKKRRSGPTGASGAVLGVFSDPARG